MLSTHPHVVLMLMCGYILPCRIYLGGGGDAELSAGTPLASPYDLCSDTINRSHYSSDLRAVGE